MHQGIVTTRSSRPAGRSRPAGFAMLALAAGTALTAPAATAAPRELAGAAVAVQDYAFRGSGSAWFAGPQSQAAFELIDLLATSSIDGIDPRQFNIRALQRAARRAAVDPVAAGAADRMLNDAFVRYVSALRALPPSSEWTINDREAIAERPSPMAMLRRAAASGGQTVYYHDIYARDRPRLGNARLAAR